MPSARIACLLLVSVLLAACAMTEPRQAATWDQVISQSAGETDYRYAYGSADDTYGELRLPKGPGPWPVMVVIHGGCWLDAYSLDHIRPLAEAITALGYATWTIEYRRADSEGGGWPQTFVDVASALDALRELADTHSLDLERVSALGHSAGGQLALMLAARSQFGPEHPLYSTTPLPVQRVIALAAISDMMDYGMQAGSCQDGARKVIGGSPDEWLQRFQAVDPSQHLPLASRVELLHARADPLVPYVYSPRFSEQLVAAGGQAQLHPLPEWAGHFDVLLTDGPVWQVLREILLEM